MGHNKRTLTNRQTGTVWGRKQELLAPLLCFVEYHHLPYNNSVHCVHEHKP